MHRDLSAGDLCHLHQSLGSGRLPVVEGTDPVERIHIARYQFAARFVHGKAVLDIATGIGYGAHLLAAAGKARDVTGVDISEEALSTARERYQHPALSFRQIVPGRLPFGDASFDVVVSFETIEHTADPGLFLGELQRVLRPGGPLIISTPNKRFHSLGRRSPWNPHHAFELFPGPFHDLLTRHFGKPEFWGGQDFLPTSPGAILWTNWVEFRYYRLLGRSAYTAVSGMLRRIRRLVLPPGEGTPAEQSGGDSHDDGSSEIVPWEAGREPYTMVAVCRLPIS